MVNKKYIPERGDIVWLNFNPQTGHEQKGKRPALVISPKEYNEVKFLQPLGAEISLTKHIAIMSKCKDN